MFWAVWERRMAFLDERVGVAVQELFAECGG